MTEEKKSAEETLRKAREQQSKLDDALSLEQLREAAGADKVEAVDNEGRLLESTDPTARPKAALANLQKVMGEKAQEQRLQGLVSGKIKPPNDFVAYLVQKIQKTRTEFIAVQQNIRELSIRTQQMKERALVLQGENNTYLEDIKHWDKKIESPSDEDGENKQEESDA